MADKYFVKYPTYNCFFDDRFMKTDSKGVVEYTKYNRSNYSDIENLTTLVENSATVEYETPIGSEYQIPCDAKRYKSPSNPTGKFVQKLYKCAYKGELVIDYSNFYVAINWAESVDIDSYISRLNFYPDSGYTNAKTYSTQVSTLLYYITGSYGDQTTDIYAYTTGDRTSSPVSSYRLLPKINNSYQSEIYYVDGDSIIADSNGNKALYISMWKFSGNIFDYSSMKNILSDNYNTNSSYIKLNIFSYKNVTQSLNITFNNTSSVTINNRTQSFMTASNSSSKYIYKDDKNDDASVYVIGMVSVNSSYVLQSSDSDYDKYHPFWKKGNNYYGITLTGLRCFGATKPKNSDLEYVVEYGGYYYCFFEYVDFGYLSIDELIHNMWVNSGKPSNWRDINGINALINENNGNPFIRSAKISYDKKKGIWKAETIANIIGIGEGKSTENEFSSSITPYITNINSWLFDYVRNSVDNTYIIFQNYLNKSEMNVLVLDYYKEISDTESVGNHMFSLCYPNITDTYGNVDIHGLRLKVKKAEDTKVKGSVKIHNGRHTESAKIVDNSENNVCWFESLSITSDRIKLYNGDFSLRITNDGTYLSYDATSPRHDLLSIVGKSVEINVDDYKDERFDNYIGTFKHDNNNDQNPYFLSTGQINGHSATKISGFAYVGGNLKVELTDKKISNNKTEKYLVMSCGESMAVSTVFCTKDATDNKCYMRNNNDKNLNTYTSNNNVSYNTTEVITIGEVDNEVRLWKTLPLNDEIKSDYWDDIIRGEWMLWRNPSRKFEVYDITKGTQYRDYTSGMVTSYVFNRNYMCELCDAWGKSRTYANFVENYFSGFRWSGETDKITNLNDYYTTFNTKGGGMVIYYQNARWFNPYANSGDVDSRGFILENSPSKYGWEGSSIENHQYVIYNNDLVRLSTIQNCGRIYKPTDMIVTTNESEHKNFIKQHPDAVQKTDSYLFLNKSYTIKEKETPIYINNLECAFGVVFHIVEGSNKYDISYKDHDELIVKFNQNDLGDIDYCVSKANFYYTNNKGATYRSAVSKMKSAYDVLSTIDNGKYKDYYIAVYSYSTGDTYVKLSQLTDINSYFSYSTTTFTTPFHTSITNTPQIYDDRKSLLTWSGMTLYKNKP